MKSTCSVHQLYREPHQFGGYSFTLIVWGKESPHVGSFKFFICFHKNEFVLFSAIDFENSSFLALRINVVVLLRQILYGFQFLCLWYASRVIIADLISSFNQSGCVSRFTRFDFTGACLFKLSTNISLQLLKLWFGSVCYTCKVVIASDKSLR